MQVTLHRKAPDGSTVVRLDSVDQATLKQPVTLEIHCPPELVTEFYGPTDEVRGPDVDKGPDARDPWGRARILHATYTQAAKPGATVYLDLTKE
jgi:hypothetical protein